MLRDILFDLRSGVRMMRRNPGFTAVALVTMALGIGANTAMFSIVNGVILKPLPYPKADRIVRLWGSNVSRGWGTFSISPLDFWDWRAGNRSLELFGAFYGSSTVYTGGDRPLSLAAYRVSEDYLRIVGGEPSLGRGFTAEDMNPDAPPVVILTRGFWQSALGADPEVLGKTLTLDGVAHTIVGVLPRGWRPPRGSGIDLVLPLTPSPYWYRARSSHFLQALGRLKPGVTVEQAQAEFSSIASALEAQYPETNTGWGAVVRPLGEVIRGPVRPQLLILMASVGLVLLIACANLVNMMLARATIRARELAIRTAVGAARNRVVRQLLAESILLAGVGGILGVGLAYGSIRGFATRWPDLLPRMQEVGLSVPVLLFTLGVCLASGVLLGLVPALAVGRLNLSDVLRQGGRSLAGGRSRNWMRSGLVVAEVGLAVVPLVGTGLLVRSFAALSSEDPGFETDHRLVFSTPLPRARYAGDEERRSFAERALAQLRAIPGVEDVAVTSLIPIQGFDQVWGYWVDGRGTEKPDGDGSALFYRVTPGYHETMGISLLAGRGIRPDDRADGPRVAIVSASLAEQTFPGQSPVGQRVRLGRDANAPLVEIVGVVGDIQHYNLGSTSMPQMYVPFAQYPTGDVNFVLRASVSPASVVHAVRGAIAAVDPDEPLEGVTAADAMVAGSISRPRFRTVLMTAFGLVALLLAVVGLYGVMAYSVSQRSKEIGVRMALGATQGSVLGLVFLEGATLVGIGLAVGLGGALGLSRLLESVLFGVGAKDPAVFTAVPVLLAAVAAAAVFFPAHRAAGLDPVRTLGEE
jgi:putative ABC transport system permease protein